MKISRRQKEIVNPFPEQFTDAVNAGVSTGGRNGNYDYESERNKWIIEGIQDSYLNYGTFPSIGKRLSIIGPIQEGDNVITIADAMAYCALYPQNATVDKSLSALTSGDPVYNPGVDPLIITRVSEEESQNQLVKMLKSLDEVDSLYKFITPSAPESLTAELSFLDKEPTQGLKNLSGDRQELLYNALASRMTVVNKQENTLRTKAIRQSLGNNPEGPLIAPPPDYYPLSERLILKQPPGLDFVSWTNNIGPASRETKTYYNPRDRNVYFLFRTSTRDASAYDLSSAEADSQDVNARFNTFREQALRNIYDFCEKTLEEDDIQTLSENLIIDTNYGDTYRPTPPLGYTVWILAARIPITYLATQEDVSPEIEYGPKDSGSSRLAITKNVIEKLEPLNSVVFTYEQMKRYVRNTLDVLRFYDNKLIEDGIDFQSLSGLRLENEIIRFSQVINLTDALFESNGIFLEDSDVLEFRFDENFNVLFYGINGTVYFKGIGRDPETLELPPEQLTELLNERKPISSAYLNYFESTTSTTMGYLFNSPNISALSVRLGSGELPPWTEFLPKYTYPNPNANSFLAQGIERAFGNKGKSTTYAGSFSNSPKKRMNQISGNGKDSGEPIKTSAQVEKVLRKRSKTEKQIYAIARSAVVGCDTNFSKYLKTGLNIYSLYYRKADTRAWLNLAIQELKVHLKEQKKTQLLLSESQRFLNNPEILEREVQKYVDREIDKCIDAIGKAIITEVISPSEKPKNHKSYRKPKAKKSGKLSLKQSATRNYLKPWWKKIKKMFMAYVKQLIVSVLTDVMKAALGCGPEVQSDSDTKDYSLNTGYGALQINLLLDDQTDIDYQQLAINCGLLNRLPSVDDAGEFTVVVSDPTIEQLRQYHSDVSDFLTSEEALALLDGNAGENTIFSIDEMVNRGPYSEELNTINEENRNNVLYSRQFQESLFPSDTRYATLGIDPDNIISYYSALGELLEGKESQIDSLDPRLAYCVRKEPGDGTLELGLSEAQLIKQVDRQVEVAQQKIKDQCEFFNQKIDISTTLQGIFDGLPFPKAYEQFLAKTAAQSRRAQRSIFGQTQAGAQQAIVNNPDENTQLFKFSEDLYGENKSTCLLTNELNTSQAPAWYIGSPSESDSDSNLGRVHFTLLEEHVEFYLTNYNIETSQQETRLICRAELSDNNLSNAQWAPGYFSAGDPKTLTLKGLATATGTSANEGLYPTTGGNIVDTLLELNKEGTDLANNSDATNSSRRTNRFIYLTGVQHGEESEIKELIKDFYITDVATRRLKRFTDLFSEPFFTHTGDVCNPSKEERIAEALMESIQTRILNFFLNTGPLTRSILNWNTPDTTNSISKYLTQKIQQEVANKGLLNVFYDALEDMSKTFSRDDRPGQVSFNMENIGDYPDMMTYVINQSFQVLFKRASQKRRLWEGYKNFYSSQLTDPAFIDNDFSAPDAQFQRYLSWFKTGTFRFNISSGDGVRTLFSERSNFSLASDVPTLAPLELDSGNVDGGLRILQYYVPMPLINALQIIYFDQVVNVVGRFPSFRFYAGQRVAAADDGLLSAVNDVYTQVFSQPFDGYPVTIEGITYYSAQEIQERIALLRRQRNRLYELENIFGPVALYEDGYTSTGYATGLANDGVPQYLTKDLDEFRDFFNPIYNDTMQKYMDLYDTPEKRKNLIKTAIQYKFTSDYQEEFKDGRVSDPSVGAPIWIRERAWYERARLLGAAPSEEDGLIRKYQEGYDITETERFTIDGVNLATKKPPEVDETFGEALIKSRAWMLNQNSYTPDPGITNNLQDWWNNTGYWGLVAWVALLSGVGAATVGLGLALGALAAALAGGGAIVGFAALPVITIVGLVAAIAALFIAFFQGTDYEDPNSTEALRALSNDVPLPENPPEANDPHRKLPVDIIEDFIGAVEWFNTELKDDNNNPIHANTLDKVAINALYYELVWNSHYYKRKFDPENDASELVQLLDYLDIEEQAESFFPVYFASGTEQAFTDGSFGRIAFFSQQQIQDKINELRNHPLYVVRQEILEAKSEARRNLGLARQAILSAESGYALREDPLLDNVLDDARATIGGDFGSDYNDVLIFPSLTDYYATYENYDEYMAVDVFDEQTVGVFQQVLFQLAIDELPDEDEQAARGGAEWRTGLIRAANLSVGGISFVGAGLDLLNLNDGTTGVLTHVWNLVTRHYPRIRELAGGETTFWGDYGSTPEGAKNLDSYEQALDIVQSDIDQLEYILEELRIYGG